MCHSPPSLKATLLEELVAYARQFSRHIGYTFHSGSIMLTAYTGCAATEIGGVTTTSAFHLASKNNFATNPNLEEYKDLRMVIVDEVSFIDHNRDLKKLSSNLQAFTQCREYKYGKHPIVFLGDFRQLFPVGGKSILEYPHSLYWTQAVNCMVELKGTHRFRNCPIMKEIMPALHQKGLSEEHRKLLNSRVIDGKSVKFPKPDTTRVATFFNRPRSAYNRSVFRDYLRRNHSSCTPDNIPKTALVIKSKLEWGASKKALSPTFRKVLFEHCTDAQIRNGRGEKCDPFLTLIQGCPIMGTRNEDVGNGIANGTCAVFRRAVFKPGKSAAPIQVHGKWVYGIDIDDVDHLVLEWTDSKFEGTFRLCPTTSLFTAQFPLWDENGKVKRVHQSLNVTHFSLVINYATTGHKLQGKSLDLLVIAEWSKQENWAYVVLSRVRTLAGLYLKYPIPRDIDFEPSENYKHMMSTLRLKLASPTDTSHLT